MLKEKEGNAFNNIKHEKLIIKRKKQKHEKVILYRVIFFKVKRPSLGAMIKWI